ncbi:MAG: hypothetical protein IJA01_06450 [Firmicutes bacterium]|nr:hypothetical protein [Bacillota bacterium]
MRGLSTKYLDLLRRTYTIYDFIAVIYCLIDRTDNRSVRKWEVWHIQPENVFIVNEIESMLRLEIESACQNHSDFIESYLTFINDKQEQLTNILIETIILCDKLTAEFEKKDSPGYCSDKGTLNKNGGTTGCYIYNIPPKGYDGKIIKANKKRRGGNFAIINKYNIDRKLEHLIILDKEILSGYEINVKQYTPVHSSIDGSYSIGIISIFNNPWFEMIKNNEEKSFHIIYKDECNEANKIIIDCIKSAVEENVDFIVLPEIIMNETTQKAVRKYLIKSYSDAGNLKLVFMGSLWKNGENTGVVLSAAGRVLFETKKINPYTYYDKEEQKEYIEDLNKMDKKVNMVDIEGVGRITYSICRDGLIRDAISIKAGYLMSNMEVISAYSQKTDEFNEMANSSARGFYMSNIFCNSCAAIECNNGKHSLSGFVSVPYINEKEICNDCKYSYKEDVCYENKALCKGCVSVFKIKVDTKGKGMTVDSYRKRYKKVEE